MSTGQQPLLDDVQFDYLVDLAAKFARISTSVSMGFDTLIEPDDPKLIHYSQEVIRPELRRLGLEPVATQRNNLIVKLGEGTSGETLLIQNYTPVQHNNLMDERLIGSVLDAKTYGGDGAAVFGPGIGQCKAHQAVMLAVIRWLEESNVNLKGSLVWAVNSEGRSSNACSQSVLNAIGMRPQFAIVQIGTQLTVVLGHRGRMDINVRIRGRATHSSEPHKGFSAIDGCHELLSRLKRHELDGRHKKLGLAQLIVYKIKFEPYAPHTLPSDGYLTLDRRLVPGETVSQALTDLRDAIGDLDPFEVDITPGPFMAPSLIDESNPWLGVLYECLRDTGVSSPEAKYVPWTFDAGATSSRGIPTVTFGASAETSLLGPDFVHLNDLRTEAETLIRLILAKLG